jgi:hypothetical protein
LAGGVLFRSTIVGRAAILGVHLMNDKRQRIAVDEPVGIIISRGDRDDVSPRVSAYIWGPVPTDDDQESKAA